MRERMEAEVNRMKSSSLSIVAALSLLGACGGEAVDPPAPATVEPTLSRVQELVFTPGCARSGCHDAAAPLDLSTPQASLAALVMQRPDNPVARENAWMLVKPSEPERSFLIRKLEGPGVGEGGPMPSASETLTPFYLDLISQWIAEGAQP
jgi:hypothetical protein